MDLLAATANLLSYAPSTDSLGSTPEDCEVESAQFIAWKFGNLVGRFVLSILGTHGGLFKSTTQLGMSVTDHYVETVVQTGEEWEQEVYWPLIAALALAAEHEPHRDWHQARARYMCMWMVSRNSPGEAIHEIGPESDLYWSARIGFADKMLEAAEEHCLVPSHRGELVPPDIDSKDMLTPMALRLMRIEHLMMAGFDDLGGRLPTSTSQARATIERMLGQTAKDLPSDVMSHLIKAEKYFGTEVNDPDAIVGFARAVESCVKHCVVEPLISYLKELKEGFIRVPAVQSPTSERVSLDGLQKLPLWRWADLLDELSAPVRNDFGGLAAKPWREFLTVHLGQQTLPHFGPLAKSLREVQKLRGGSAHSEYAESQYERKRRDLDALRNLVLGIGGPSVISEVFRLLGSRREASM